MIKFIFYEKATKFCEIFPLFLTVCTVVKTKGKISQNFVAFSEYMNFTCIPWPWPHDPAALMDRNKLKTESKRKQENSN